jgi:ribonuclease P protein component
LVLYAAPGEGPSRHGFVVGRRVGKAVVRNRVRRRIKAIGWELAREVSGLDVVVRALPSAADAPYADLEGEVRSAVHRLAGREAA